MKVAGRVIGFVARLSLVVSVAFPAPMAIQAKLVLLTR